MNISLIAVLVKRLGAACLTFVILWHVTQHAGSRRGKAIVHVYQPGIMVQVDQQTYHVGAIAESPVVCELEPGPHTVALWRSETLVGVESFAVEPGEEVVLCPHERQMDVASMDRSPQPVLGVDAASLADRSSRPDPGHARNRRAVSPLARTRDGTRRLAGAQRRRAGVRAGTSSSVSSSSGSPG
jgi:hypothetical protein